MPARRRSLLALVVAALAATPHVVAQASLPAISGSAAPQPAGPIDPATVLATMERAADWQLAQPAKYSPAGWENAPFYIGTLALARISASPRFHDAILARATANAWQPARRLHHADDHCVIQAYAELSRLHRDPAMLAPSRQRLDAILAAPATGRLDWGLPRADDRTAANGVSLKRVVCEARLLCVIGHEASVRRG